MAYGEHIRDVILEEVRSCRFFSIIADGGTYFSNCEQLSIVLRFLDDEVEVRESLWVLWNVKLVLQVKH